MMGLPREARPGDSCCVCGGSWSLGSPLVAASLPGRFVHTDGDFCALVARLADRNLLKVEAVR